MHPYRWVLASLIAALLLPGLASRSVAQTPTVPAPTVQAPTVQTPTGSTSTSAFDSLSPGNQKIALALFNAQRTGGSVTTGTGTTSTPTPLTLDQIAAKKQGGEGWGRIFQDMKAQGLVQAKNLGQVVSRSHRASGGPVVTAGGHRFDDGIRHEGMRLDRDDDDRSEHARLGQGRSSHHDDDQARGGPGFVGDSARGSVYESRGAGSSVSYEHGDYGASRGQTFTGGSGRAEGGSGHVARGGK